MFEHMNKEKYSIDHASALPLHAQVEDLLRQMIEDEPYKLGEMLPKEVDLSKLWGISRNTLRQATNKLVYEGLLERKKGVGTRVTSKRVTTNLDNWMSFTQEMNEKGIAFRNFRIGVSWVKADEKLATIFGISEGREILRLERLRGSEEGPFVHFISWFHPRVGLTGAEDFSQPLYDLLEKDYATVVVSSKEEINAMLADKVLAESLEIRKGNPVLLRKRWVCDPGNRMVEYNEGFYRGDKFTYSIDIKRGK